MEIIENEIKKIVKSPIVIGLTVLFILFNLFIMSEKFCYREDLKVLNTIVKKVGYKIDEKMIENFKNYYEENLNEVKKIINKKEGKTYKNVADFYENTKLDISQQYNIQEQQKIKETCILENYYYSIEQNDMDYKKINMKEIAEYQIKSYRIFGEAAKTIRSNYKKFQKRLDNIRVNGEHRNLFFIGKLYEMHSFLFKDILRNVIFEIAILGCLIILFIVNYEFHNNTSLIVYCTKRGRNLVKDKMFAGLICICLVTTIILGTTLIIYFSIFSYEGLWKIPISSYFNWEGGMGTPFMSWFPINMKQYLILFIILVYVIQMLFGGITFLIARITKNTYIGFFIFFIVGSFAVVLSTFVPKNSNFIIYSNFNPFFLTMHPNFWFMHGDIFTTYKCYELITVLIWGGLLIITGILSVKKFKKEALN
ncbi:hypothetical protein [Hathewaya limosa]|uniref:Ribosomal protein S17E n=1 Tax=Hathewaya limosa TaxID=1536 RepID=A0ABU0JSX5_HATLI|nr:hypothetical protein [Hathewaya limosa]MDQ0480193.1 ribosomal protein S17E [Hathewaya limosa]